MATFPQPRETPEILFTPAELANRWGRTPAYLADLRASGRGPRFVSLSERVIRYRLVDVEAYEKSRLFASTAAVALDGDGDEAA
jgi:hypothetical protein